MTIEQEERMSPGQRRELMLFTTVLMTQSADVLGALTKSEDEKAETALAAMDSTVLYIRNAIGQHVDRVICPVCRKTGRNKPVIKQGKGVIHVGFKCEHCAHEWGLE